MKIEGEYWKWLAYVSSRNYVKRCGNVEKDGFLKAYYNILDSAPSSSLSKIIDRYITIQKEEHRKNYDENTQNELRLKMLISKPHCSTSVLNYVTYLKEFDREIPFEKLLKQIYNIKENGGYKFHLKKLNIKSIKELIRQVKNLKKKLVMNQKSFKEKIKIG